MAVALENLSIPQLVETYNKAAAVVGANKSLGFDDHETAVRRTRRMQEAAGSILASKGRE